MAGSRVVTEADVLRGKRLAALRKTRWASQGAMVRDVGVDRVRLLRVESGEDRFTSRETHELFARFFGLEPSKLAGYAHGDIALSELVRPGSAPAAVSAPQPTATDPPRERYPNRPPALAAARVLGKSEAAIAAVAAMCLKSDDDPTFLEWLKAVDDTERDINTIWGPHNTFDDRAFMAEPPPPPRKKR